MEERRVQKSGASTLTVSLPAEWVDAVGLGKGDVVLVTPTSDGGLTLYPARERGRDAPAAVHVRARRLPDAGAVADALAALYAAGWERVTVTAPDALPDGVGARARDAAGGLAGLEVLSETRAAAEFAASLDADAFPLRAVLRRLELTGSTALADAFEALAERDAGLADAARVRALDAERLLALARRHATLAVTRPGLTRVLAGSLREAVVLRVAAEHLAALARDAAPVADAALDVVGFDVQVPPESLHAVDAAHAAFREARDLATGALLGDDPARAFRAKRLVPAAREKALDAVRRVREAGHPSVARRLSRIGALLDGMGARVGDVAGLTLELAAARETDAWAPE